MVAIEELQLAYESLTLEGRRAAVPEPHRLERAELRELDADFAQDRCNDDRTVKVQFNPETLKVTLRQPDRPGAAAPATSAARRRGSSSAPARRSSRCSSGST